MQLRNESNRLTRLTRFTASRPRSLRLQQCCISHRTKETKIIVVASTVDIAGILVLDDQPIAYGSRALSDVESRYSQTEREALAGVLACEHFDIYVRGPSLTVVIYHKSVVHI